MDTWARHYPGVYQAGCLSDAGNILEILWSVTQNCPFRCSYCCMSASPSLSAASHRPNANGKSELDLSTKLSLIDKLRTMDCSLELSGGDILSQDYGFDLITYAGERLGPERVSITTCGVNLSDSQIEALSDNVRRIELTIDMPTHLPDPDRSSLQNATALEAACRLVAQSDLDVVVHTVLRQENIDSSVLESLHSLLSHANIPVWKILRLLPVGRATGCQGRIPNRGMYQAALEQLTELAKLESPKIAFHYLFDHDLHGHASCRAMNKSIGISPEGEVLSCFWAYDSLGRPLHEFVLGKFPESSLDQILRSDQADRWRRYGNSKAACVLLK